MVLTYNVQVQVYTKEEEVRFYTPNGSYWKYTLGKVPRELYPIVHSCLKHQSAMCGAMSDLLCVDLPDAVEDSDE